MTLIAMGLVYWVIMLGAPGLVVVVLYLLFCAWDAKRNVEATPKKEMFICDVHGPLPLESTINLFDGDVDYEERGISKRGPVRQCPICFEERIKQAKRR